MGDRCSIIRYYISIIIGSRKCRFESSIVRVCGSFFSGVLGFFGGSIGMLVVIFSSVRYISVSSTLIIGRVYLLSIGLS